MAFPSKKPAPAAAGKKEFTPAAKGTKPTHVLKAKVGEDGKFERITGLFEGVTKTGESYLKGTDKEGVNYIVMLNNYDEKQAAAK